jgi:uncharacterized RDD family membrane protein YckC
MSLPDEILSIDTPENVVFGYQVADIGTRFLAALVDTLLILLLQVVAYLTLLFLLGSLYAEINMAPGASMAWLTAIFGLVTFAFLWGYYIFFEMMWSGQTPGKRWIGLRVIRSNGTPVTLSETVIRNLVRVIDFLPLYYGVGVVTMFLNDRARRLGDLAAGTLVVYEQGQVTLDSLRTSAASVAEPLHAEGAATATMSALPLHRLTNQDVALATDYLRRRWELANGRAMAIAIATSILERMDVQDRTPTEDEALALLRAVAALPSQRASVGKASGTTQS